jgi:hypothetical protein
MPVPSQESDWSCIKTICVLGVSTSPVSTTLWLEIELFRQCGIFWSLILLCLAKGGCVKLVLWSQETRYSHGLSLYEYQFFLGLQILVSSSAKVINCIIIFSPDKNQNRIQWLFPPKKKRRKQKKIRLFSHLFFEKILTCVIILSPHGHLYIFRLYINLSQGIRVTWTPLKTGGELVLRKGKQFLLH